MNTIPVVMVRIYITESSHLLNQILDYLKSIARIRGMSVFRGISGSGETGNHTASFMDISLDLPLVIEFFDDKDKVDIALEHLTQIVKPEHIIIWDARANH